MERKTFAFRLAARKPRDTGKWQARDDVAVAGCSLVFLSIHRERSPISDNGQFC